MEHAHAHDHDDLVTQVPSDPALRIKALESLLVEKGLVGPHNGARVVARAWADEGFRERLLVNGTRAVGEMDLLGPQGQHIVVVANTPIARCGPPDRGHQPSSPPRIYASTQQKVGKIVAARDAPEH